MSDERSFAEACARGDSAALARFETELTPVIRVTARRFGSAEFAQEIVQRVRERMLVGPSARIAMFTGEGSLAGFVQAVTVRVALNALAAERKDKSFDDEAVLELPATDDDPELAAIKQRYRTEFKEAFSAALALLDDESRTALKLYYLDGLELSDLGKLYAWSVPTASRRLAAARTALLTETRRHLSDKLGLNTGEIESVLRLLQSRLSASEL